MGRSHTFFVAVLLLGAGSIPAHAALLGLTKGQPDVAAGTVSFSYSAAGDSFVADGVANKLELVGGAEHVINDGDFDIVATITSGGALTSGTVTVAGNIPALGINTTTPLLTGSLTDFGYLDSAMLDIFEFTFNVTGGELADDFGGNGGPGGIILNAFTSTFSGSFASDFNGSNASADTFAIPEPTALAFLGIGALAVLRRTVRPGAAKRHCN